MITEASPLQWPNGWSRTENPNRSRFDNPSIAQASDKITNEMRLFGGSDLIISSDLRLKKDGMPYSNQRTPEDQGVAVYFIWDNVQKVIACDSFDKIGCNLWAIAKTIEAMRGIDRWGCSEIINKAFTGFTALPENASESNYQSWWEILKFPKDANEKEIKAAYRILSKRFHPDIIGHSEIFLKVKNAYENSRL